MNSWSPGRAWLPLWKSPTPPPAQLGRGPAPPPLQKQTHIRALHLVCLTAQGEERRGQKLSAWCQAGHWSGQTWAPPGHTSMLASEDQGESWAGLTPAPPQGPTSGKWVAAAGEGAGRHVSGLAGESLSWVRTPWSSLCPPFLGPGGPSKQVSFLSSHQAQLDQGHPSTTLQDLRGRQGHTSSKEHPPRGGGQEAQARAGRSWVCFPTSLRDLVGILADSPPG